MAAIHNVLAGVGGTVARLAISTNLTNLNLYAWAVSAGWDELSPAEITVESGVYVYSTSTSTPAITIDGVWPSGVKLINDGFIMGMGGTGGYIFLNSPFQLAAGLPGGTAISLGVNCAVVNNSYIGGGGGGGGGFTAVGGGGGAGGGLGIGYVNGAATGTVPGGAPGQAGSNGRYRLGPPGDDTTSAAGGRIMPGVGGLGSDAIAGGSVSIRPVAQGGGSGGGGTGTVTSDEFGEYNLYGGTGGSAGNPGGVPNFLSGGTYAGGGGGGWGASGGAGVLNTFNPPLFASGGAGGKAFALNGFTATRTGSGTTYGAVS